MADGSRNYVLITPARDEAATLERTIESVLAQTVLPRRWVIVSDGSTDGTDTIAARAAKQHAFIAFVRRTQGGGREFGSKVYAIRAGMEHLTALSYAYIGNLDADVTFEPGYYESVLAELEANPGLGIAGGTIHDLHDGVPQLQQASEDSVAGAIQLFRRACYEEIGGYAAVPGGVDTVAEWMARWKGWETRSFPALHVMHLRPTDTGGQGVLRGRFKKGMNQYAIGWSPLFVFVRGLYRLREPPFAAGSLARTLGYCWAYLKGEKRAVPAGLVRFIRQEQHDKLRGLIRGTWRPQRPAQERERDPHE